MRIVVTGALGHIGSRIIRDLPFAFPGAEIVMIDNLATQRYASLFDLPANGCYRFVQADVKAADLRPILDGAHCAVHLAAMTDAAGSFDRAAELEENNFKGTANVAAVCAETGVRLISLSSTSVYGTQQSLVAEDCAAEDLKPQSPYAATKLKEEALLANAFGSGALRGLTFRFGTIYGVSSGMRFHTAVNKFCWQAVMGQPLTVWSTAFEQKRPYLDLGDASRAIEYVIRNDLFDGRIYNVLTDNASVRQIVETIREYAPNLRVTFVDSPIMNQLSYEVSCERFLATGFRFGGDLRRGIAETIGRLRTANHLGD